MKKGWTLLEVLVVLIIIAIIASFAIPQYIRATKRAIASEAIKTISSLKDALTAYNLEHGVFTTELDSLDLENPNKNEGASFKYQVLGTDINKYTIIAVGKELTRAQGLEVTYDVSDNIYNIEYQGQKLGGKKLK